MERGMPVNGQNEGPGFIPLWVARTDGASRWMARTEMDSLQAALTRMDVYSFMCPFFIVSPPPPLCLPPTLSPTVPLTHESLMAAPHIPDHTAS